MTTDQLLIAKALQEQLMLTTMHIKYLEKKKSVYWKISYNWMLPEDAQKKLTNIEKRIEKNELAYYNEELRLVKLYQSLVKKLFKEL